MKTPTLTVVIVLLAAAIPSAQYAWWVTAEFEATDTVIESIPVNDLDRSWVVASPLREGTLDAAAQEPGESLRDHDAAFEFEGDFNRDGKTDKALVGVFRASTGQTGGFLLVLTRGKDQRWTSQALFKNPGGRFSALTVSRGGRLTWWFCLECDGFCNVVSRREEWKLDCESTQ